MAGKDLYERLCDSYGLQMGEVQDRENLLTALKQTLTPEALTVYFCIPIFGKIDEAKIYRKARRSGFEDAEIEAHLKKLKAEGFIETLYGEDEGKYTRVLGAYVAENQVRMKKGTALGKRYAKYWMDLSQVSTYNLPTSTPYARVLAVTDTITPRQPGERIVINEEVADPREALPYDVVTDMVREAEVIALAECYCRLSMEMAGEPCSHEKETCFLFDNVARSLMEIGVAHQVTVDEALVIIKRAEEAGLVHNTSNAKEKITFLCNCCPCCCPILGAVQKGLKNVSHTSRFIAVVDQSECLACGDCTAVCYTHALVMENDQLQFYPELCIGCGLCAGRCSESAIQMSLRDEPPAVFATSAKLEAKIQQEAIVGKVKSMLFGK